MRPRIIGEPSWWACLALLGVPRDALEALVVAVTEGGAQVDPHRLRWAPHALEIIEAHGLSPRVMPLLVAAGRILHHRDHPGYGALMHLRLDSWYYGDKLVRDWIIEQYASMIGHGGPELAESAWYSLGVDFCEDHEDGNIMLPALQEYLPRPFRLRLLDISTGARWSARRSLMFRALKEPEEHAALARHIGRSAFSGFSGSFDVADARRIAARLHLDDPALRAWLDERLSATQALRLIGVVADGGGVRIALAWQPFAPSWFDGGTEIALEGRLLGMVRRFRVSMDLLDPDALSATGVSVVIPEPRPDSAAQWHSVTGRSADWMAAAGKLVTVSAHV